MSTVERAGVALEAADLEEAAPDELPAAVPARATGPIRVHGKFFFAGAAKHFVKGVTYGPFAVGTHGSQFPERAVVGRDFQLMRGAAINTLRVFTVPPVWLLDMADHAGRWERTPFRAQLDALVSSVLTDFPWTVAPRE